VSGGETGFVSLRVHPPAPADDQSRSYSLWGERHAIAGLQLSHHFSVREVPPLPTSNLLDASLHMRGQFVWRARASLPFEASISCERLERSCKPILRYSVLVAKSLYPEVPAAFAFGFRSDVIGECTRLLRRSQVMLDDRCTLVICHVICLVAIVATFAAALW